MPHDYEAWNPDWIDYVYSGLLRCKNDSCKECVANSRIGGIGIDYEVGEDGEPGQTWGNFFTQKYFEPPLHLINIPEKRPESVADPLNSVVSTFFAAHRPPPIMSELRLKRS